MSDEPELELGQALHNTPTDQRQILCLTGGGYRGLYTSCVLEALEDKAGCAASDMFDVLSGTSVGGLVAAALAVDVPASNIRSAMAAHGRFIFDQRIGVGRWRLPITNPLKALYRAKYRQAPLVDAIDDLLGERASATLDTIDKPLLLVSVDVHTGGPFIMRSKGLVGRDASTVSLKDALLATAAAPTYFPPHALNQHTLIDGGLIANAPDLVAVTDTVKNLGVSLGDVRVLSVGTAGVPHQINSVGRSPGVLSWLVARGLFQLTLSAQETLAVEQCSVLLGDRYLRLDDVPPEADQRRIGLDRAGPDATAALERAAARTVDQLAGDYQGPIRRFLSHRVSGWVRGQAV